MEVGGQDLLRIYLKLFNRMSERNIRWDPYVMIGDKEFQPFWKNHLKEKNNTLFIMGKGFDTRMNLALDKITNLQSNAIIDCLLVEFDEGKNSSSAKYKSLVAANLEFLNNEIKPNIVKLKKIKVWEGTGRNKRKIASRQASDFIITDYDEIKNYSNIIVDISSLPRGIYFSLIGKILYLIDRHDLEKEKNFFVIVAENTEIDFEIKGNEIESDLDYLKGFGGGLDLSDDSPIIWLPILGEDKKGHIDKAFKFISPDELCPILPFPAKNPRRGDKMIVEYHQLLFEELLVEPQNIMYVSEQNPFDAYRKICSSILHYKKSIQPLGNCRAALTTFSSKLLSLGALLAAYDLNHPLNGDEKIGVGVINVDSQGYEINDTISLDKLTKGSELFVIWLTGEPYHE